MAYQADMSFHCTASFLGEGCDLDERTQGKSLTTNLK